MSRKIFQIAVLTTTLMTAAWAQGGWSRDWSRGDNRGYGNPRYGRTTDPVTGAMRDLESIFRRARVDRHEADHFRDALRELDRFQERASRGRFDRHALDRAIDEMRDLARAHQLHPRDRQLIAFRAQELRRVRDGGFGYRY